MKTKFLIVPMLLLLLAMPIAFAQTKVNAPSITPDSGLWGFKVFVENIQVAFTSNPTSKVQALTAQSNERVAEQEAVMEKQISPAAKASAVAVSEQERQVEVSSIVDIISNNADVTTDTKAQTLGQISKQVATLSDVSNDLSKAGADTTAISSAIIQGSTTVDQATTAATSTLSSADMSTFQSNVASAKDEVVFAGTPEATALDAQTNTAPAPGQAQSAVQASAGTSVTDQSVAQTPETAPTTLLAVTLDQTLNKPISPDAGAPTDNTQVTASSTPAATSATDQSALPVEDTTPPSAMPASDVQISAVSIEQTNQPPADNSGGAPTS